MKQTWLEREIPLNVVSSHPQSQWIIRISDMVTKIYAIMYDILASFPAAKLVSMSVSFASSEPSKVWLVKPSSGTSSAHVSSQSFQGIYYHIYRELSVTYHVFNEPLN
jgi:hypothetical protein